MRFKILINDPKFKIALLRNQLPPIEKYKSTKEYGWWREGQALGNGYRELIDRTVGEFICNTNKAGVFIKCYVGTYRIRQRTEKRRAKMCNFYLCYLGETKDCQYLSQDEIHKIWKGQSSIEDIISYGNKAKDFVSYPEENDATRERLLTLRHDIYEFWHQNYYYKHYASDEEKEIYHLAKLKAAREEREREREEQREKEKLWREKQKQEARAIHDMIANGYRYILK